MSAYKSPHLRANQLLLGLLLLLSSLLAACGTSTAPAIQPTVSATIPAPTATAQPYPTLAPDQLYPPPPPGLDALTQYPSAKYLEVTPNYGPGDLIHFDFETNDAPEVVEAYYRDLLVKQGWKESVPVEGRGTPRYFWGDNGRQHVYGYNLSFFGVENGRHLKTYFRLWTNPTDPVYLGATDVSVSESAGIDTAYSTVSFKTADVPAQVKAFYQGLFAADGWQPEDPRDGWQIDTTEAPLFWERPDSRGFYCNYYRLHFNKDASGLTAATLDGWFGHRCPLEAAPK